MRSLIQNSSPELQKFHLTQGFENHWPIEVKIPIEVHCKGNFSFPCEKNKCICIIHHSIVTSYLNRYMDDHICSFIRGNEGTNWKGIPRLPLPTPSLKTVPKKKQKIDCGNISYIFQTLKTSTKIPPLYKSATDTGVHCSCDRNIRYNLTPLNTRNCGKINVFVYK